VVALSSCSATEADSEPCLRLRPIISAPKRRPNLWPHADRLGFCQRVRTTPDRLHAPGKWHVRGALHVIAGVMLVSAVLPVLVSPPREPISIPRRIRRTRRTPRTQQLEVREPHAEIHGCHSEEILWKRWAQIGMRERILRRMRCETRLGAARKPGASRDDRCNLRCMYCMPEEHYRWLPQDHLLSFEELVQLVDIFAALGVRRVRLTGGEPLLRRNLDRLVSLLAANSLIEDLALTTNGILLAGQAGALRRAGLHRVSVSLDTLRPERFLAITRRDEHARVLDGIAAARREGFAGTKIDTVMIRGVNDDELCDLIEFGRANDAEVRFIEYMDVPGATQWTMKNIVRGGNTGQAGAVLRPDHGVCQR